ncbi:MAG: redox-sensing transcriptional repressor Rex [Clostridia bacterium]|nr:redox-sensing transcriptional repressor Rex [Clostridia bacterium]
MSKTDRHIAMPVIRRLPRYYRCLCNMEQNGIEKISSRALAEAMNITASQVRQDLNCFGGFGQQGYGYIVSMLRGEIAKLLGMDSKKKTVLYGVGNLGRAIIYHFDFEKFGFELCGLFDTNPELVGTELGGLIISDDEELEKFTEDHTVDAAILCIPTTSAEEVVEKLYAAGVRCFLNFNHFDIKSRYPDCVVENVHLSESLMTLGYLMTDKSNSAEE